MITLRHKSLKLMKLQVKAEAVENPECDYDISAQAGHDRLESILAQYLKLAMQETISQFKERMVRLIQLKDKELRDLQISRDSLLLKCRRVEEEKKTEGTAVQKDKEIKEKKRRRIVQQTKKKLRRNQEEIREVIRKQNTLEQEKNKMEIKNEELSKVNIKLLSENKNLKEEFSLLRTEKKNLIELKEKVTELLIDTEKIRNRFEKEGTEREKDLAEMRKELNIEKEKVSSLSEENTLLKEQLKTYQNLEIANKEIRDILEKEGDKREKDLAEMRKEMNIEIEKVSSLCEENTLLKEQVTTYQNREIAAKTEMKRKCEADIEAQNKGPDPTSHATDVPDDITVKQGEYNCNLCKYKSNSEARLSKHLSHKHNKCDICNQALKTPALLRSHLRETHDKKDGTMKECSTCKFSALNENHLNLHINRHHKELILEQCTHMISTFSSQTFSTLIRREDDYRVMF